MKVNEVIISAAEREGTLLRMEKDTYRELYELLPDYGVGESDRGVCQSPGKVFLDRFLDAIGDQRGSILDAGCGAGHGALELEAAGFNDVITCDLLDHRMPEAKKFTFHPACLWHPLRQQLKRGHVDWVYCCDVLEHLPTQFVGLAIDQMLRIANHGLFISVMMETDLLGAFIGKTLHQTVRPFRWWRETCDEVGRVLDARDLKVTATFLVEPR